MCFGGAACGDAAVGCDAAEDSDEGVELIVDPICDESESAVSLARIICWENAKPPAKTTIPKLKQPANLNFISSPVKIAPVSEVLLAADAYREKRVVFLCRRSRMILATTQLFSKRARNRDAFWKSCHGGSIMDSY